MVGERIERMRSLAEARGRRLRFGVRLHVIARDRSEHAWSIAERWLDEMEPAAVQRAQARLAQSSSVGQQRMLALRRDRLEVAPNLWAGVGLVRGNAGTALVGSHAEIAERIEEYRRLGCDEFILSGFPHLEEAYWVAEGVVPLVRRSA